MIAIKSLCFVAVASLALAGGAGAQIQADDVIIRKVGSINYATYDLKTGDVSRQKAGGGVPCWSNTDNSIFFSLPGSTGGIDEWISPGGLATSNEAAGCAGGSNIIESFTFGYASNVLGTSAGGPGVTIGTTFYDDTVAGSTAGAAQSGLLFSGLPGAFTCGSSTCPGSPGWIITVCLSGGFNFCLDDTNGFGFGLIFFSGNSGPLLCYAGDGLGGPDGNGQSDSFDWYSPPAISGGTLLGSFFFGGPPFDFSSWYLEVTEEDGSCATATAVPVPSTCNLLTHTNTPLLIGGTGVATITSPSGAGTLCVLIAYSGPAISFKLPLGGISQEIQVDIFGGSLLAQLVGVFFAGTATITTSTPKDLALCGLVVTAQGVGFGTGAGGPGVRLSNATELTLGF